MSKKLASYKSFLKNVLLNKATEWTNLKEYEAELLAKPNSSGIVSVQFELAKIAKYIQVKFDESNLCKLKELFSDEEWGTLITIKHSADENLFGL